MNEKVEDIKKNQKLENIKSHLKKNKTAYFAGAGSLAVGVLGTLAFTQRVAISQQAQNIQLLSWKPFSFIQQVFVNIPARGNRGLVIYNKTTDEWYGSQNEAAKILRVSAVVIADHLKGITANVHGNELVCLGENLTEQVKAPK